MSFYGLKNKFSNYSYTIDEIVTQIVFNINDITQIQYLDCIDIIQSLKHPIFTLMKAASAKDIKQELSHRSQKELLDLCLRLSRFKKENKELLTYLLFEADNEQGYISSIKNYIDDEFENINTKTYRFISKAVRKILRNIKKFIRFTKVKETEVELLLYFCYKLKHYAPYFNRSSVLKNILFRQIEMIRKKIANLHEDLQFDYEIELKELI